MSALPECNDHLLPECADHDRTPVTVMLTKEQAVRLEAWLAGQRESTPSFDEETWVDSVFEAGLCQVENLHDPTMLVIQRELAYIVARGDIESLCQPLEPLGERWHLLDSVADEHIVVVALAKRYLCARGLLETHPDNPGAVRVRELEATP